MHHACGYDGAFAHAAVGHEAVEADLLACVVVPGFARGALVAAVDGFDRDAVTHRDVANSIANGDDPARELVSERDRKLGAGQRVWCGRYEERAGVVLVKVASADTVVRDLDLDLSWEAVGFFDVENGDVVAVPVNGGTHADSFLVAHRLRVGCSVVTAGFSCASVFARSVGAPTGDVLGKSRQ